MKRNVLGLQYVVKYELKGKIVNIISRVMPIYIGVIVFTSGCTMSTHLEKQYSRQNPIAIVVPGSKSLSFDKVVYDVKNQVVGHHHDGYLRVKWAEHQLYKTLIPSDHLKVVISDELRKYGYNIIGGNKVLFSSDEEKAAEYMLGAMVSDLQFNTYAPLAGGFDEVYVKIEWQLYDVKNRKIIYKKDTDGYIRKEKYNNNKNNNVQSFDMPGNHQESEEKIKEPENTEDAVIISFRKSLLQLLNDQKFVDLVQK